MIRKIVVSLVLVLLVVCAGLFWLYSDTIARIPVTEKVVALTYDDGPNPPHTRGLLELLAQHRVKATFFPKGRNVEAFPDALRAVAEAGHEVGNHSYYHRAMTSLSLFDMQQELERSNALIKPLVGYRPVLFRPPFGIQGPGLKLALDELQMSSILMDASGVDWEVTDAGQIARSVLDTIETGSIILLHDGHGDIDDPHAQDSRAASVAATGIIITTLKEQGYRFVTVGELMAMSGH